MGFVKAAEHAGHDRFLETRYFYCDQCGSFDVMPRQEISQSVYIDPPGHTKNGAQPGWYRNDFAYTRWTCYQCGGITVYKDMAADNPRGYTLRDALTAKRPVGDRLREEKRHADERRSRADRWAAITRNRLIVFFLWLVIAYLVLTVMFL
jgi:hypothetical protein